MDLEDSGIDVFEAMEQEPMETDHAQRREEAVAVFKDIDQSQVQQSKFFKDYKKTCINL